MPGYGRKHYPFLKVVRRARQPEYNYISLEYPPMEISWGYLVDFGVIERRLDSREASLERCYGMVWKTVSLFPKWRERNCIKLLAGDEVSGEEFKGRALIFLTF